MAVFGDSRTQDTYRDGFAVGIPKHVGRGASHTMQLLVAARTWQDVGVIGKIARFLKDPGRYGLHVEGKWFVTFTWLEGHGATEILLERR